MIKNLYDNPFFESLLNNMIGIHLIMPSFSSFKTSSNCVNEVLGNFISKMKYNSDESVMTIIL